MTTGTEIYCITESDMLEFMHYIREHGGECICTDWEARVLRVIRGTTNDTQNQLFNRDGVLGAVNVSNNSAGEKTE